MQAWTDILQWLWYLSVPAKALLVLRLATNGLWRRYPWFTAWVSLSLARTLLLLASQQTDASYQFAYMVSEAALFFALVAAVWEIFALHLSDYSGTDHFRRNFLIWVMAISVTTSLAILTWDLEAGKQNAVFLFYTADRVVNSALAAFMLISTTFLASSLFGVRTRSNVLWLERLMALFLVIGAVSFLLVVIGSSQNANLSANLLVTVRDIVIYVIWAAKLSPAGHISPERTDNPRANEEMAELLDFMKQAVRSNYQKPKR